MSKKFTGKTVVDLLVFLFAIINLFPLYWLFTSILKRSFDITRIPPDWLPGNPTLDNIREVLFKTDCLQWILNSLIVSVIGTGLVVIVSAMAAYAFSKLDFPGSKILYPFFIGTLMIPKESYIVPLFRLMTRTGLSNTYSSMILPTVALPFGVFLLKSFFDNIPNAVRESAKIDGAREYRIFTKIILPMATPGISALFILMFVRLWNDYLWQLLMGQSNVMKTLMVGVTSLMEEQRPDIGRKLTGAAISAVPMIVVYLAFQKFFSRGISVGAVKE